MRPQGTVERAYQLARLGPCINVVQISEQLHREHYSSIDAHLSGQATHRHIAELCRIRMSMEARMAPRT